MNAEFPTELMSSFTEGRSLNEHEVTKLEEELAKDPSDLTARLKLVGYYQQSQISNPQIKGHEIQYVTHLLWMILHEPANEVLQFVVIVKKNAQFKRVRDAWLEAVKIAPGNTKVANNAAKFCVLHDPVTAEKVWLSNLQSEPNNEEWPRELSFVYSLAVVDPKSAEERAKAQKAFEFGRRALELHKQNPGESYLEHYMEMSVSKLADIALLFECFSDADYFGNYLLNRYSSFKPTDSREMPRRFEAHMGHSILGRSRIAQAQHQQAVEHLSAMPPLGSPTWRFDMMLAQSMLNAGLVELVEPVCAYMAACAEEILRYIDHLDNEPADPSELPALVSIDHQHYAPDVDLTEFIRSTQKKKIAKLKQWQMKIKKTGTMRLPTFI